MVTTEQVKIKRRINQTSMDSKEKVLTLASAARKVGIDPDDLKQLIFDGKLDAVETEGGNLLIGEESLKGIIKEIQSTELAQQDMLSLIHI